MRAAWLLFAGVVLSACAGLSKNATSVDFEEAYQQRAETVGQRSAWDLWAQLSIDDGEEGGSGRFHWRQRPGQARLDFRGTLGRGAWRLTVDPGVATLTLSDGTRREASSVDQLAWAELGWRLPVSSLAFWVRGLAAPGEVAALQGDAQGRPARIEQDGWIITIDEYDSWDGHWLPRRLEATHGAYRVKLVTRQWSVSAERTDG